MLLNIPWLKTKKPPAGLPPPALSDPKPPERIDPMGDAESLARSLVNSSLCGMRRDTGISSLDVENHVGNLTRMIEWYQERVR